MRPARPVTSVCRPAGSALTFFERHSPSRALRCYWRPWRHNWLSLSDGGLEPRATWPGAPDVAWTAETAFFALFDAATGQHGQAAARLDCLAAHRTKPSLPPEQVNSAGKPTCTARLSWTYAVTLQAITDAARDALA